MVRGSCRRVRGRSHRSNRTNGLTLSVHSVICASHAGIAQLVERNLAKVEVASSSLVSRSSFLHDVPAASSGCVKIRSVPR